MNSIQLDLIGISLVCGLLIYLIENQAARQRELAHHSVTVEVD